MDAWSPEQLKKMQLGGNGRLNNFLKKYGVKKETEIKEKYNSPAAEVCFISGDRHNKDWCLPAVDSAALL